jgi:hypothetical protein
MTQKISDFNSLTDWRRKDNKSYLRAWKLGIQREIAEAAGWEIRKSFEQWYEEFLLYKERPKPGTKEGKALDHLQQQRPDLYNKLLELNPNLRTTRKSYEQRYEEFLSYTERPKQGTKEGKALSSLQQYRPDLYSKLLKRNPNLRPTKKSFEQWYEEFLSYTERPKQGTKEGGALNGLQQQRPDLYNKLLELNPNLRPTKKSYEQRYEEFLSYTERPKQGTKEGKALNALQQRRPDLYSKLLKRNPNLKPRVYNHQKN